MSIISFLGGGQLGDYIHQLYAVKNLCEKHKCKADLYITGDERFGGGFFFRGEQKTYEDLYPVIISQSYVNSFQVYSGQKKPEEMINTNLFRSHPNLHTSHWSRIMSDIFNFEIPKEYKWMNVDQKFDELKNRIVIHRSTKRIRDNPDFNWNKIFEIAEETPIFMANEEDEYKQFPFLDKVDVLMPETLSQTFVIINSCKLFIGNQSSPFAFANAMDVNRVLENPHYSKLYLGEAEFSNKIRFIV